MPMQLQDILRDEDVRNHEFPVTRASVFMAHAGVAPLTHRAAEAITSYAKRCAAENQEADWVWPEVLAARKAAAGLLGCSSSEVSLIGPTALGLSLVAGGLPWAMGDEVVYYADDYPANVYPWTGLAEQGVYATRLRPPGPGRITWDVVEEALSDHTRLVALASCHFLTGYRIDIEEIGRRLRERGILFCLDGIQTLGAFSTPAEYVDFMAADAHKWMLGPNGSGILYVRQAVREELKPMLRGAWNVHSPHFIAQDTIQFEKGGRRFEPGTLNLFGIFGMKASLEFLAELGAPAISRQLLSLRRRLVEGLETAGFDVIGGEGDPLGAFPEDASSSITSVSYPGADMKEVAGRLAAGGIQVSLRTDRDGHGFIRISPHAYNTDEEADAVIEAMKAGVC